MRQHFLSLLALLLMGVGGANAATEYGIYVASTPVTSANASDVLGNGQFSYDNSTKTLTVKNANLTVGSSGLGSGIDNREVDGLRIWLSGTSTINTYNAIFTSKQSFSIEGPGTLNGTSSALCGIYLWGENIICTVDGPTVNLTCKTQGVNDYKGTAKLKVMATRYTPGSSSYATSLTLQPGSGFEAVNNLGSLLRGSNIEISEPAWGVFNTSLKTITEDSYKSEAYMGKVVIGVAWPLYVNGTKVTQKNSSRISGSGISGTVSYDASSKTLTLNGATINGIGHNCIQNNGVIDLNIKVVGTNNLDIPNEHGMQLLCLNASTSITGTGTLNLRTQNRNYCIRAFNGSTLTINGPTVSGCSQVEALAFYGNNGKLAVKGTSTKVALTPGDGYATVSNMQSFELGSGLYITQPKNVEYSSSLKSFCLTSNSSQALMNPIIISSTSPGSVTEYGMYIAETMVSSANASDVLNNGQFSYNNSTKTLTVKNANLKNSRSLGSGISNREIDGLRIALEGTNTISARMAAISVKKNTTISGTGSLDATSTDAYAFYLTGEDMACTINGPKIKFTGKNFGLCAYKTTSTLKVYGTTTDVTLTPGSGYPAISNLGHLEMSGTGILQPTGGYFSETLKSVTTDGSTAYKGTVNIGKIIDYGCTVGETPVTNVNASDVLGDGHFSYDASTNMLTMRNANLTNDGAHGSAIINWSNDGLTIKIEGTNTFFTRNQAFALQASTNIIGSGTLTGTAQYSEAFSLGAENITCTINGPQIDLTSNLCEGLKDHYKNCTLIMKGSTTSLTLTPGGDYPAVRGLGALTLEGQYITSPMFAEYSPSLKSITVDGSTAYCGKVVISSESQRTPLYIGETALTRDNAWDILGNGQFSYDIDSQTLTMRNANFNNDSYMAGITNVSIDNLNIHVIGENSITTRLWAISTKKSLKFTGNGSLTLTSTANGGITFDSGSDSTTCVIDGPQITIITPADGSPFCGGYYDKNTVTVKGATTSLDMQTECANGMFYLMNGFTLDSELSITEPEGCYYDTTMNNFTTDGRNPCLGRVVIGQPIDLGIYVAETRVNTANAADILGNGTFSYDRATRTLTVRDANLTNTGVLGSGISNREVEGLTIRFEGTSYFYTRTDVIDSEKTIYITGDGTLNGYSIGEGYLGASCIYLVGDSLDCVINGPTLNLSSNSYYGIYDYYNTANVAIYGENTKVTLNPAPGQRTIFNLKNLELDTCLYITEPAGAWFDNRLMSITTDGESAYSGQVVISSSKPGKPEPASLMFVMDNESSEHMILKHNTSEYFNSPTFVAQPEGRKLIWRTNISEMPDEGGEPIQVEVQTEPYFEVRLLNTDVVGRASGTGQTDVSVVVYDEYVTAMATLDISFYADVYQEPDTTTMAAIADTANETISVDFGQDNEEITEETDLTNTEVGGVLFTLNEQENDGYDATDESIVLNSTMSTEEVEAVLEQLKPGSGAFAAMFSGMTFLLPAGNGYFDVDFLTMGDHALTVKIGHNAAATFTQNEKGTVRLYYDCEEDTYVYIYGSEIGTSLARMAPTTLFAKHAPRHAEANDDAVKVYGFSVTAETVDSNDYVNGDINGDGVVDVSDYIGVANHILGVQQENFNEQAADVDGNGSIDVSDYIGIANIILTGSPYGK